MNKRRGFGALALSVVICLAGCGSEGGEGAWTNGEEPAPLAPEAIAAAVNGAVAESAPAPRRQIAFAPARRAHLAPPIVFTEGRRPVLPDGCPEVEVREGGEVIPQTLLHLGAVAEGEGLRYRWSASQPAGSVSVFSPSATVPDPVFPADAAGEYTFCLEVQEEGGRQRCPARCQEVFVIPDEAIHVELLWTTPGDEDETDTGPFAGSDMDLHFLHPSGPSDPGAPDLDGDGLPDPYFDSPYDCYWFNPHPDWAGFGSELDDDPGLDRDDTDGGGPENINLDVPEAEASYRVAVHYWNDHGYGAGFATVRVYLHGILVYEVSNMRLINHDLWCAVEIDWPSGVVTPCEAPEGGLWITPNYQHPMFFN